MDALRESSSKSHGSATIDRSPPTGGSPTGGFPADGIQFEHFLDCVHCGLCTSACPTYLLTGDENDSPRGRIYLMRGVAEGRWEAGPEVTTHVERCLDCRACETACPSGVQYGRLIEPFRVGMQKQSSQGYDWFHRWVLFGLFPYRHRLSQALLPARWAARLGLINFANTTRLTSLLPSRLRRLVDLLPKLGPAFPELPEHLPAQGKQRARVALFTGCVADAIFRGTHWATARVLQANGCEVLIPRTQACCGAIHFHAGASEPAKDFARQNVSAFNPLDVDAVVVNVAGCGAMLKDHGHHWHDEDSKQREKLAAKVRDVHEFLDALGPIPPRGEVKMTATYHDACHLRHAQKVQAAPRKLLSLIPGLKLQELPESDICCGAAGTYNLTQPDMADQLGQRKAEHIASTGATKVITANAGCLLQIAKELNRRGHRIDVLHPMDVLDKSYRVE